jgi:hypothetical protein
MALHELQFSQLHSPIMELARKAMPEDGERAFKGKTVIDLNPPYQRASVWTTEQRVNLIKSLMQGLPVGAVFVNERRFPHPWACVDGKQRIETIVMWLRDEFAVPGEWFEEADLRMPMDDAMPVCDVADCPGYGLAHGTLPAEVRWSDLSDRGQRRAEGHWSVAQYRTRIPAEMEPELYERINYGGTPHEPLESR